VRSAFLLALLLGCADAETAEFGVQGNYGKKTPLGLGARAIWKPGPGFGLTTLTAVGCTASTAPLVREGDIIFHTSGSAQSLAIQKATHSRYSHMGLILYQGGRPHVFEAIGTVQYTPLDRWVRRGVGGHFVVKRLQRASALLTPAGIQKVQAEAHRFAGKSYDLTFEWSDDRIYCSELVWKVYQRALGVRVGELQRLRDFDLTDPAVQERMRERFGPRPPLDELVISPAAMFDWSGLETVAEK